MKKDIKSLLEFAEVDVTKGKAKKLVETQDTKEVAARAVEHAEDELGEGASKSAIRAFVKKMYGDEIARLI